MSLIIVDTSAYSAFMRGHKGIVQTLQKAEAIYISAIIIGELLAGFVRGKYEKKNREELEVFMRSPRVHFIEVDYETAERYGFILILYGRLGLLFLQTIFGLLQVPCNMASK